MMRLVFLSFVSFLLPFFSYAQPGCTDPQASNYDAAATENDGSCLYEVTNYSLLQVVELPEELKECSGIEWLNSGLYIQNDAGNEDKVYRVDSLTGEVEQAIIVATADNEDWEDLANSDTHLFIGDFGNNIGDRTDLRIYRIAKNDLSNSVLNADLIEFSYEDQVDFTGNYNNHDFDCEAFIFYQDSLHLFTKNWVNNKTRHYVLPAMPGTHSAVLRDSFNIGGLITSADVTSTGEVALLGYTELGVNFMWLLHDFPETNFFKGNRRKISLGNGLTNSQTEGITFRGDGYGYICSERFTVSGQLTLPQKLLAFSIKQWIDLTTPTTDLEATDTTIFPNPCTTSFVIQSSEQSLRWQLFNPQGQLVKAGTETEVEVAALAAGTYNLVLFHGDKAQVYPILKN